MVLSHEDFFVGGFYSRRHWLDRIGLIVSDGLSGSYRLDCIGWIVSSGSYFMDCIGIGLGFSRRNWLL